MARKPWQEMTPAEKREDAMTYIRRELRPEGEVIFGCDDCGAVEGCEFAFDPYNIDSDCLAEK